MITSIGTGFLSRPAFYSGFFWPLFASSLHAP